MLRILSERGVRVIPALTGVAKMMIDSWLGSLEKHRYVVVGPDAADLR